MIMENTQLTASNLIPFIGAISIACEVPGYDLFTGELTGFNGSTFKVIDFMGDELFCFPAFITPICRPFSDLTKEIEHDGEMFVPRVAISQMIGTIYNDYKPSLLESGNCITWEWKTKLYQIWVDMSGKWHVIGPEWLIDLLRSWGFPIGLPAGSWKEMEE